MKESLIALLSRRSGYQDAALLQLKHTLVDLESQLGHNLTPKRIADIARGQGGHNGQIEEEGHRAGLQKMTAEEKSDLMRKLTELDMEDANDDESAPPSPTPM